MDPLRAMIEEGSSSYSNESSSGSNRPVPAENRRELQPSPFLTKTYDLVDDPSTDQVISWSQESSSSSSFIIWDPRTFSSSILPKYFKHNNFSNFIRQLNSYGFKKINPDRWEFANVGFIRGHRHLMTNNLKRRTPQAHSSINPCPKFEDPGFDKEVHKLRKDRHLLMTELVKLRQVQKTTRGHIRSMEQRLRKTELKQQQTTRFLARAIRNPEFVQKLSRTKDMMSEGAETGLSGVCSFTENELEDYVDISECDMLDMDMSVVFPIKERGVGGKEAEDQLVGEFLDDWIKEELRVVNLEEDGYV